MSDTPQDPVAKPADTHITGEPVGTPKPADTHITGGEDKPADTHITGEPA